MKKIEMAEVEVQTQPDGKLLVTFNVLIDSNKINRGEELTKHASAGEYKIELIIKKAEEGIN